MRPPGLPSMRTPGRSLIVFVFTLVISTLAVAQDAVVTAHSEAVPAGLADGVRAVLAAGGQHVAAGTRTLDFWWVKTLPLAAGSSGVTWESVPEGTLVGAVQISANYPDIRGKTIKAGLYTLRYALQPENGDHLGVSPYRDFLLLSPAGVDTSAATLSHDDTVNLSKQSLGISHPATWSLDPPVATSAPSTVYKNDAGFTGVVFQVPVSRDGKDVGTLKFGLILVGSIQS